LTTAALAKDPLKQIMPIGYNKAAMSMAKTLETALPRTAPLAEFGGVIAWLCVSSLSLSLSLSLSHYIEETYQNTLIYPGTFFQGRDMPKWRRCLGFFMRRPGTAPLYRKNAGCGTGIFCVKGLAEFA
jgi:hypothetical protein